MKTPIVHLVGSSVRAAAQSAVAAGWNVIAWDDFADTDLLQIAQHRGSPRDFLVRRIAGESVTSGPVLLTGGTEPHHPYLDEQPDAHATHRILHSPESLSTHCQGTEIAFPDWFRPTAQSLRTESSGTGPWIRKSPLGCGGVHIQFAKRTDELTPTSIAAPASDVDDWKTSYLQQLVSGIPISVTAITFPNRTQLLGMCIGRSTAIGGHPFVYAGSIGPFKAPNTVADRVQQVIQRMRSKATHLRGLFGIDLMWERESETRPKTRTADELTQSIQSMSDTDELTLLEINPRWTASMELVDRAQTASLIDLHFAAIHGRPLESEWMEDIQPLEKRIHFANRDLTFLRRHAVKRWCVEPGSFLADIPIENATIPMGHPICTSYRIVESVQP
ncbi:MAG: ATP-grasp domain-containing protein [Planctomycetota bacterium]